MTTLRQDEKFKQDVIPDDVLQTAVDWIAENMKPNEVFEEDVVREWVADNCNLFETFDEDFVFLSVASQSKPGDVFSVEDLSEWAKDNGYTKEE